MFNALKVGLVVLFFQFANPFAGFNSSILGGEILEAQPLRVCLNNNNGRIVARRRCGGARFSPVSQDLLTSLSPTVQGEPGPQGPQGLPGIAEFVQLSPGDTINLFPQSASGPNVVGSSVDIGDISPYRGLVVEWTPGFDDDFVTQQFVFFSDEDKQKILEADPDNPGEHIRYVHSFGGSNSFAMGFSVASTRLWLSSWNIPFNQINARLIRVYGFK